MSTFAQAHALPSWLELTLGDPRYPRLLQEIHDPPPLLYARGRIELLNAPCFAIVGSRNATSQGIRDAHAYAERLSASGLTIVSGLALGIDAAAHRGGLAAAGSTIAVLGNGIDIDYPRSNRRLAQQIATHGCIVSEFPPGMPPLSGNFPRRNRLISGMSRGVLVVEAGKPSGSLITAGLAAEQNRDVFALPGSIHSPQSRGCHHLIKQGAALVDSADDILVALGIEDRRPEDEDDNAARAHPLLEAIGFGPATIDEIAKRTGLAAAAVAAQLSLLEISGDVAMLPGGAFQRVSRSPRRDRGTCVIE